MPKPNMPDQPTDEQETTETATAQDKRPQKCVSLPINAIIVIGLACTIAFLIPPEQKCIAIATLCIAYIGYRMVDQAEELHMKGGKDGFEMDFKARQRRSRGKSRTTGNRDP